jgi:hypothetical protein
MSTETFQRQGEMFQNDARGSVSNENISPPKTSSLPRTSMNEIEWTIVRKLQGHVTFPPGHSHKRFILGLNEYSRLSDRGRNYLAYIANRYRRQWKTTHEEFAWIVQWCTYGVPR